MSLLRDVLIYRIDLWRGQWIFIGTCWSSGITCAFRHRIIIFDGRHWSGRFLSRKLWKDPFALHVAGELFRDFGKDFSSQLTLGELVGKVCGVTSDPGACARATITVGYPTLGISVRDELNYVTLGHPAVV